MYYKHFGKLQTRLYVYSKNSLTFTVDSGVADITLTLAIDTCATILAIAQVATRVQSVTERVRGRIARVARALACQSKSN